MLSMIKNETKTERIENKRETYYAILRNGGSSKLSIPFCKGKATAFAVAHIAMEDAASNIELAKILRANLENAKKAIYRLI